MKASSRKVTAPPRRRYFKEVRFRQIRALVETARHASFAAAARTLGMATPSVWRQVRALEDEYGVPLVATRGQDVRLTEDGELLADLARPVVEGFDSLRKVFTDRHGRTQRQLRVATPATVLNSGLRGVIADYRQSHPQVKLALIDVPSRTAWEHLEADKADLAIVGHPEGTQMPSRFEVVPLQQFAFHVCCLASHPFAAVKKPTLRDLLKQPLILAGEHTSSRMQFDHIVAHAGLSERVNVAMTASNHQVILNYVAMGLGVAIVTRPSHDGAATSERLMIRDFSHVLGHEHVVLLHPKGRHELAHVKAFRELVVQQFRRTH